LVVPTTDQVQGKAQADMEMPAELSSHHILTRLAQLAALLIIVGVVVWLTPGLGSLRGQLRHASIPWFAAAAVVEVLSTLSYVVIFRAVFCGSMSWRISYQIGMAEQAANSLLPAGGAGGLALGAWALNRAGMSTDRIARRTVAFFILTSLANVGTVALFAVLFAVGIFGDDSTPAFTYAWGAAALLAIGITLSVPIWYGRWVKHRGRLPKGAGRLRRGWRHVVDAVGEGTTDSVALLVRRPVGVLVGSFGYMGFDIAALGFCFKAFGHSPGFGVVVFAYLIGQLGGLIPIPGGIGGTEGGLIGVFAIYRVPVVESAAAVLAYRALALWIPAALGSVAFVKLRKTLKEEKVHNETICEPLAEPIRVEQSVGQRGADRQGAYAS
jgi:uncharacterized membrane protein YbhN (UPF0104 family)